MGRCTDVQKQAAEDRTSNSTKFGGCSETDVHMASWTSTGEKQGSCSRVLSTENSAGYVICNSAEVGVLTEPTSISLKAANGSQRFVTKVEKIMTQARSKKMIRRSKRSCRLTGVIFIVLLTLCLFLLPWIRYGAGGITAHAEECKANMHLFVRWFVSALTSVFMGSIASFFILRAWTPFLWNLAVYVVASWLEKWCVSFTVFSNCGHAAAPIAQISNVTYIIATTLFPSTSVLWMQRLLLFRVSRLEAASQRDLGRMHMERLFYAEIALLAFGLPGIVLSRTHPDSFWVSLLLIVVLSFAFVVVSIFSALILNAFYKPLQLLRAAEQAAEGALKKEARWACKKMRRQLGAISLTLLTIVLAAIGVVLWETCGKPFEDEHMRSTFHVLCITLPQELNTCANMLVARFLADNLRSEASQEAIEDDEEKRNVRRRRAMMLYRPSDCAEWDAKVQELASRGFSLRCLLSFYKRLGKEYMPHFDPERHTTKDVVRQTIIPLSRDKQCALATLMTEEEPTRASRMVTHTWSSLFHDLVAAVVADALDESSYGIVAYLLEHDISRLEKMVNANKTLDQTYWICAFSVSQHDSICGGNPYADKDSVTGHLHATCTCGKPKYFNTTEPLREDGKSIRCEMNKFADMMHFLATRQGAVFEQVIAVDRNFTLFERAWCVAEISKAHETGLKQNLKIFSSGNLQEHRAKVENLKVEEMQATRPEDIEEILATIPNKEIFNRELHNMIFHDETGLFATWRGLDSAAQMDRIGKLALWHEAAGGNKSFYAAATAPPSNPAMNLTKRP